LLRGVGAWPHCRKLHLRPPLGGRALRGDYRSGPGPLWIEVGPDGKASRRGVRRALGGCPSPGCALPAGRLPDAGFKTARLNEFPHVTRHLRASERIFRLFGYRGRLRLVFELVELHLEVERALASKDAEAHFFSDAREAHRPA